MIDITHSNLPPMHCLARASSLPYLAGEFYRANCCVNVDCVGGHNLFNDSCHILPLMPLVVVKLRSRSMSAEVQVRSSSEVKISDLSYIYHIFGFCL